MVANGPATMYLKPVEPIVGFRRSDFVALVGEAMQLVRADLQVNAIRLFQSQTGCNVFRARIAVDIIANRLSKVDPKVVPFRKL